MPLDAKGRIIDFELEEADRELRDVGVELAFGAPLLVFWLAEEQRAKREAEKAADDREGGR